MSGSVSRRSKSNWDRVGIDPFIGVEGKAASISHVYQMLAKIE